MYLVVEMENESRQSSSQQHANDISTCREPNQYFITAKLRNREIVIFTHCIDSESSPSSLSLPLSLSMSGGRWGYSQFPVVQPPFAR